MGIQFSRNFYEQVNGALSSASSVVESAMILSGLLLDPEMFSYSRALVFSFSQDSDSFFGRVLLGADDADAHTELLKIWAEHRAPIAPKIALTHEATQLHKLYSELYTAMLPHIRHARGGAFETHRVGLSDLPENHILRVAATQPNVFAITPDAADITGLEQWLQPGTPLIAGRVITRRGLEGVMIASRRFETSTSLIAEISLFQWLLNLCSSTMDSVQMIEDMRENAKRLEEVDRLKSSFLSIVSHELRTPLTAILGFLSLLSSEQTGDLNPTQKTMVSRAYGQARHIGSMVEDLLKLAGAENGAIMRADLVPTRVQDIVQGVIDHNMPDWMDAQVRPPKITQSDFMELPRVMTDPNALQRILQHLLDNAYKFRRPEKPNKVYLDFEVNRETRMLDIAISDSGIGMLPEQIAKVFDGFYQADFSLDRSFGGLGIGLLVVKLLLKATGGTINIVSHATVGTRITVSFPLFDDA